MKTFSRLVAVAASLACFALPTLRALDSALDTGFVSTISPGLTPSSYVPPPAAPDFSAGTGAVNAVALLSDGKILAGGNISRYQTSGALSALKRLLPNGALDTSFNSGGAGLAASSGQPEVNVLLTDSANRTYVGGTFSSYNGTARSGILRLLADGTLDPAFAPTGLGGGTRYARTLALLPDGKLLVGGSFSSINGTARSHLARLNADGSLDTTFSATAAFSSTSAAAVGEIAVLPDGRILVGATSSASRPVLIRLLADGTLDPSFSAAIATSSGFGAVNQLALLPDGRIAAAGFFTLSDTGAEVDFAVFRADGPLDTAFQTALGEGPNGSVLDLLVSPDGRLLASGVFSTWDGQPRASVALLNLDGTLASAFAPAPYTTNRLDNSQPFYSSHLYSLVVQPDGKLLAGGWFARISDPDVETYNLTRFVFGHGPAAPGTLRLLAPTASVAENAGSLTLQLSRFGGTSGVVTAQITQLAGGLGGATPGSDFTAINPTLTWASGEGGIKTITIPILQDTTVELAETFTVGILTTTGGATVPAGFGSTVVTLLDDDAAPSITRAPVAVTTEQGARVTFSVRYSSVLPATVKWQRDPDGLGVGAGFTDIAGATGLDYVIATSDPALHNGHYRAVVTSTAGSTTSTAAELFVAIPAGSVVTSFAPPALSEAVVASTLDNLGRHLVGTQLGLRRYTLSGELDPTFTTTVFSTLPVSAVHVLSDDRIIVGGFFTTVTNGTSAAVSRPVLARFSSAGVLDTAYSPALPTVSGTLYAQTIAPGSSGKYYVGFGAGGGLRRYLSDGSLDGTFSATTVGTNTGGIIYAVRERSDGRVLVAHISGANGFGFTYSLSLLEANGTASASSVFTPVSFNNSPRTIDLLPDGRIVVGGQFIQLNGAAATRLAVLFADGTVDTSFVSTTGTGPDGTVQRVLYREGRLLVAGEFFNYAGQALRGLARVNLDGTIDSTFSAGAGTDGSVFTAHLTNQDDLFFGGNFTTYKGVARNRAALVTLNPLIGAIGFAPPRRSVVESSGSVTLTLRRYGPATEAASIRYATADALAGFTTAVSGTDYTAASGTVAWAAGDSADKTISLSLLDDSAAEPAKTFRVALSDPTGPVTAAASATLTILDSDTPATFTGQPSAPVSALNAGASLSLSATVTSPTPATYQWFLNGVAIPGATSASFAKNPVNVSDGGLYTLVVTNAAGSVTSSAALVVVQPLPGRPVAGQPTTGRPQFDSFSGPASMIALPDGGALIGGLFTANTSLNRPQPYLLRIRADGTTDTSFNLVLNAAVTALRLQPDGKVLVFGNFNTVNSAAQRYLFRLKADLTLDTAFNTAVNTALTTTAIPNGYSALNLATDSTGRIYLSLSSGAGILRRLNADGTLDAAYLVGLPGGGAMGLAVDSSDRLLVGGGFTNLGPVTTIGLSPATSPVRPRLARLATDGAVDQTFLPALGSNSVRDIFIHPSTGRIFAGLDFAPGLVEVDAAGSATVFNLGNNGSVSETALSPDGRPTLVRSASGSTAVQRFIPAATLGGSATAESAYSTGTGPGGNVTTLAYRPDGSLWIAGDFANVNGVATASVALLQPGLSDPGIVNPPIRQDVNAGATARLSVGATGTGLTYQWLKNGQPLANDARISGATTAVLAISGVAAGDDALYSVTISGTAAGSAPVTSGAVKINVLGAPVVAASPASVTPALGATVTLAADVLAASPATYRWTRNGVQLIDGGRYSGTSTGKLVITGANASDNGAYTLAVTNAQGTVSTTPATVTVAQVPTDRDPATTALSATSRAFTVLHLPDGRSLVGSTGQVFGATSTSTTTKLSVIETDGRVTAPAVGAFNSNVNRLIRQPDGKILVLGGFTAVGGVSGTGRSRLVRLNADLTLDTSFAAYTSSSDPTTAVVDASGRIYLAGQFIGYNNVSGYNYLVRLQPDGTLDPTFNLNLNNQVLDLLLQPDGKIVVGGLFVSYGPAGSTTSAKGLLRLNADGSPDTAFVSTLFPADALSSNVYSLALDSQGRILTGYTSMSAAFAITSGVGRVLPTGARDTTFNFTESFNQFPAVLLPVAGDKVLVGGNFTTPVVGLARLNADGSRDTAFTTDLGAGFGASGADLRAIVPDIGGRLWIAGGFSNYKGVIVAGLLVLQGEPPALGFFSAPRDTIADVGGSASFTASAVGNNGFTYQWLKNGVSLTDGGRVSGATTATLTLGGLVAADAASYSVRITSPGGTATSPASPLTLLAAPEILGSPASATREIGGSVTFTGSARGAGTLSYRWLFGTTELTDGPGTGGTTYSGASTPTLTITGLTFAQAGQYRLRVSNTLGTADTAFAGLTVERRPGNLATGIGLPSASGVRAIIRLSDGSMLVGGSFTNVTVNGVAQTRGRIARFLADGTLDPAFTVSFNNTVTSLAQDSSGRIFVGGNFTSVTIGSTTTNRTRVARLTSAFALDTAFDTSTAGPNAQINAVAPTDDGGVYVGGAFGFNLVGTATVNRVARLSATGALDTGFTAAATVNNEVKALLRRSDGKLYVGGTFGTALLSTSGARETGFNADAPSILAVQAQAFLLLADGSLLVGANGGLPQPYLRRLNANTGATLSDYGTLHANQVSALAQQADGKLLSGAIGGFVRTNLAGTADTDFGAFNSTVSAIAVDGVGRIWVGGSFTAYNGVAQSGLAVLTGGDFDSRDGLLAPHTLTFTDIPDRTFGDTGNSVTLSASSDRGLSPITFAVTSGPATLNGSALTITGAGEITVTASQAGNTTYRPATATQSFTVAKAPQSITFAALSDKSTGAAPFTVSATASSGLPVTFTVSGPATLSDRTVTLTGAEGTVTVTASQPGDANYLAATAVPRSFAVNAIPLTAQSITFATLANRVATAAPFVLSASASSGLPVSFEVSGPATLGTDGKTITLTGETGTVTVTASQEGGERNGSAYAAATPVERSFEVTLGPPTESQTITFTPPATAAYGDPNLVLEATASSELPVAYEVVSGPAVLEDGTLRFTGAGKVVVRATQPGAYPFKPAAAVSRTITVAKAVLLVNCPDHTRLAGVANPGNFQFTYSGFIGDDTESAIATAPTAVTAATIKSPAGTYPITIKGGLSANYTFAPGELGSVIVESFAGAIEAFMIDSSNVPRGKLELTFSPTSLVYSGVLTLESELGPITVRGLLAAADSSLATGAWIRAGAGGALLSLDFSISGSTLTGVLKSNDTPVLTIGSSNRLFVQTTEGKTKLPAPWTGAHTLVLRDPQALTETDTRALPLGSGTASATIAPTGLLTLKGTLADGTPLTATAFADTEGTYRVFAKPYAKRLGSFLAGSLTLVEHPDSTRFPGRYHVPETEGLLFWIKAASPAKPLDASCRLGFAADVVALLDPWVAPSTKATVVNRVTVPAGTLAQRLGLTGSATAATTLDLSFGLGESYDFGADAAKVPTRLNLSPAGAFTVAAPVTTPANATKFTVKVTPATGVFTGSFNLVDVVPPATKATTRKVTFTGILRLPPDSESEPVLGYGQFLLPVAGQPAAEQTALELQLTAPTLE